jgi:kinetochore protein Mis13/DSN1
VDDTSFYKHIDPELPDPDRARQLTLLCAARAPIPAPREGKDPPSEPSEKGKKLLQELKDNVLLLLAERKIDMGVRSVDQAGSPANGSLDIRPNEQNVNNRARTTRFKDEIRMCVVLFNFKFYVLLTFNRTVEQRQRTMHGLLLRNSTILTKKRW